MQRWKRISLNYLIVSDIDEKYEMFRQGFKNLYGKYLIKGIPRINQLKDMPTYGVRQCVVVDPSGNYIRLGQVIPKTDNLIYTENNLTKGINFNATSIAKAYEAASRLIEGKEDYDAAIKLLDTTISTNKNADKLDMFKILLLRVEAALKVEEFATAEEFLNKSKELIKNIDKTLIEDELRLMSEIEQIIDENI